MHDPEDAFEGDPSELPTKSGARAGRAPRLEAVEEFMREVLSLDIPPIDAVAGTLELIHSTNMSEIWRRTNHLHGRVEIVKVIRIGGRDAATAYADARREARRLVECERHPGVVEFLNLETDEDGQQLRLVFHHYDGETLRECVDRHGPIHHVQAASLAAHVCGALAHVHARNLRHRDVKPENIILTGSQPILIDFGLAVEEQTARESSIAGAGTLMYMAPEQLVGEGLDETTDLFGLGGCLFWMLTASDPYEGSSNRRRRAPLRQRMEDHEVPTELIEIVMRLLSEDRTKRFLSALDCQSAFAAPILGSKPKLEAKVVPTIGNRPWPCKHLIRKGDQLSIDIDGHGSGFAYLIWVQGESIRCLYPPEDHDHRSSNLGVGFSLPGKHGGNEGHWEIKGADEGADDAGRDLSGHRCLATNSSA